MNVPTIIEKSSLRYSVVLRRTAIMDMKCGKDGIMVAQRQQPIVINAVVGEDRRLIIDLPPEMPTGKVMVMVALTEPVSTAEEVSATGYINPERERLRAVLLAKGKLGTAHMPPLGTIFPSEEEILKA